MKPPVGDAKPARQRPPKPPRRRKRKEADWTASLSQTFNKAWSHVPPGFRQRKNELIAATAACVLVFGGAFGYRALKADRSASRPVRVTQAMQAQAPVNERPRKPAAVEAAASKKLYYDRLPG